MKSQEIFKDITLLYVEDEQNIRDLLQNAIEDKFKSVITAGNGDEGYKKFKKYRPDIVISDILMPVMNGLDMAKKIREDSKETPIVIFSAFSEKEKLLSAIDIGIDKYLIKPIDIDDLLDALSEIVKKRFSYEEKIGLQGDYTYSRTKHLLYKGDRIIELTKKELNFLNLLIDNIGTFVPHDEIKSKVWNRLSVNDAAVRTFIKRLRNKTDKDFIKNISGLGYKID